MRFPWGSQVLELDLSPAQTVAVQGPAGGPVVADAGAAAAAALEQPFEFPPLRRALTPEDHVVVVVDPQVRGPARFLTPLLSHLGGARIDPAAVTLLCPHPEQDQSWLDDLPDAFQEVKIEVHQPTDRQRLAYLATTQAGRRVYLNRTAVDADQIVVLTRRRYDSLLGHAGGPGTLFPGLGDEATLHALRSHLHMRSPASPGWKHKQEADEITWLLGAPFFLQVIEGPGDCVSRVIAGTLDSCREAERLLDADWGALVAEPADVVVASLTGSPEEQSFLDMARALAHAARVVKPGGSLVLLCDADPDFGIAGQTLRDEEEPHEARKRLLAELPADLEAGLLWLHARDQAKLYVLSQASPDAVEELFATPLDKATQVQKLLAGGASCVVLPDAHKVLTSVAGA